jgi:hypothetical protein
LAFPRCGVVVVLPWCPRFLEIAPKLSVLSALRTGSKRTISDDVPEF